MLKHPVVQTSCRITLQTQTKTLVIFLVFYIPARRLRPPTKLTITTSTSTSTTALKDFPLLAAKLEEQEQPSQGHATSAALVIRPIRSHINQYIADMHTRSFGGSAIKF